MTIRKHIKDVPVKREESSVRRILSFLSVLFLAAALISTEGPAAADPDGKTVGIDVPFEDITDFYYTYDASTAMPHYQRYRFYAEDGKHYFYHETREGGSWPQTEADTICSGTAELTDSQWSSFCDLINGGTASRREERLDSGDAGPWLYIYWRGGETEGREFSFEQPGFVLAFEEFCEGLKEEARMRISVSDGSHTIIYELNGSPSAKSLYGMLPLDIEVENYGRNEKIFYPEQAVDTRDGIEGSGEAGGLALFSPWGNVVMFYDSFGSYPGLYILGQAVEGTEQISSLSGTIHVEAVP